MKPILADSFYHIYNRGINGESIFKEEKNYSYFLRKYAVFIPFVADTYAYCLMGNHFHLLVKTKSEEEIQKFYRERQNDDEGEKRKTSFETKSSLKDTSWIISNAFSSLFKSYSISINKEYKRTGALFERPFRRKLITSDRYLSQVIYYIHANPQDHGFCKDFTDYPHSSFHAHLSSKQTKLARKEVLSWFGSPEDYKQFHSLNQNINDLIIEFD
ncbi:MAG: hypothetical protein H7329_01270 [Opitutaceae bacterium]|nr:hypothetical protein [Cytophagales bacterium]